MRGLHQRSAGERLHSAAFFMFILYIDESGDPANSKENVFVLGGVAVFEHSIYHQINKFDSCVENFNLGASDDIELHATHMYTGKTMPWRGVKERADREAMIHKVLDVVPITDSSVTLFAVAVEKRSVAPHDPVEVAFEEICNRFNLFLQRHDTRNSGKGNHRGLIVMDTNNYQGPLNRLAKQYQKGGSRWGSFRYLCEAPLFVDSKSTRLIQFADLLAWATFRRYEHQDGRFFEKLIPKFDTEGGILHGLYHKRGTSSHEPCFCPACMSRNKR